MSDNYISDDDEFEEDDEDNFPYDALILLHYPTYSGFWKFYWKYDRDPRRYR